MWLLCQNWFWNTDSSAVSPGGFNSVGQGWDTGLWLFNKPPPPHDSGGLPTYLRPIVGQLHDSGPWTVLVPSSVGMPLGPCLLCPASSDEAGTLLSHYQRFCHPESLFLGTHNYQPSPEAPNRLPFLQVSLLWGQLNDNMVRLGLLLWDWTYFLGSGLSLCFLPLSSAFISSAHLLVAPNLGGGFRWIRWAQGPGSGNDWAHCFLLCHSVSFSAPVLAWE